MQRHTYIALVSFALLLGMSSCGSSGSGTDDDPTSPSTAARRVVFEDNQHGCPYGGVLVQTGIDDNRNGTLDDDEVDASEAVCNGAPGDDGSDGQDGAPGSDGLTSLLERTDIAPGEQCPHGGVLVRSGIDDNRDGVLDELEVDESEAVCNGAPGDSVLYAESEQPLAFRSEVCPLGGTEGHFGVDTNGDGTLDAAEIDITLPADCYTEVGLVLEDEVTTDRWSARIGHNSVVFDGKLWVIGGSDSGGFRNDVWSSSDGVTWTQVTAAAGWSARSSHGSAVHAGKLWVLGGSDGSNSLGDVWSSPDGANWTQVTTTGTSWSTRIGHSSVVHAGKLWVIGGSDGSRLGDVWSSPDGANWTQVTISGTSWSARSGHSSVVFDGKLWVIGGIDGLSSFDDVWSSSDGASWEKATTATPHWSSRYAHSSVVYDGKL